MCKRLIMALSLFPTLCFSMPIAEVADSLAPAELEMVEIVSSPKESGQLQAQPVSSSSISQLRNHQIKTLKDVSTLVPNLFIPNYGSRLTSSIYVRGVGSRSGTPAVAMYVDNVPYADKSSFDFNFYDIERVDVLRGPQATLYGRNAMGGIIKVHTKNPFRYQGTDAHLSFNSGNLRRTVSLTHYHRISKSFAFSAGAYAEGTSGFWENTTTGRSVDRTHSAGGRMRGILLPTSNLKMDFSVSYDHNRQAAYPYFYLGAQEGSEEQHAQLIGKISQNRESNYRRSLLNIGANIEYQGRGWKMNAISGYQHLRDRMFLDQDFLRADIYSLMQRQRLHSASQEIIFRSQRTGRWQWLSGASLMGQTMRTNGPVTFYTDGLRWLESNINTNMPNIQTNERMTMMRLMGFESMQVNFRGDNLCMEGIYHTPMLSAALFHQITYKPADAFTLTAGLRLNYENQRMRFDSPAHVAYGFSMPNSSNPAMAVDLQDMTCAIRYNGTLRRNYIHLLPKLALQYDFDANNNVYASIAVGQRSGGYNLQMFSDLIQGAMRKEMMNGIKTGLGNYIDYIAAEGAKGNNTFPQTLWDPNPKVAGDEIPFKDYVKQMMERGMPESRRPTTDQVVYKPEHSWNYELGAHLNPTNRFMLDASLFLSTIHDQQISRFAPSGLGRMMVNAGKSLSWGGELSMHYRPTDRWNLLVNYGFTRASFLRYDDGSDNNYDGNNVPYVPQHTVFAEATYTLPLQHKYLRNLSLGVNTNGYDKLYWTENNLHRQHFQAQIGARLLLETQWGTLSLWAKNLTNNAYHTFYFISAKRQYAQYNEPRHVGADLTIRF